MQQWLFGSKQSNSLSTLCKYETCTWFVHNWLPKHSYPLSFLCANCLGQTEKGFSVGYSKNKSTHYRNVATYELIQSHDINKILAHRSVDVEYIFYRSDVGNVLTF